jgi:hypothetical protein
MQLGFSSKHHCGPGDLDQRLSRTITYSCIEFKSGRQKSGSSPNEVDTSLVKSILIYFQTDRLLLRVN